MRDFNLDDDLTPAYDRLQQDAELGRLLRRLPDCCVLVHDQEGRWRLFPSSPSRVLGPFDAPEQALRCLYTLP